MDGHLNVKYTYIVANKAFQTKIKSTLIKSFSLCKYVEMNLSDKRKPKRIL